MTKTDREPQPPALGPTNTDRIATVLRAVTGALPVVGAALAEIITDIVPDQRLERVEKYLLYLQEELTRLSPDHIQHRMKELAAIDLIEDGAYQAVRALTDERQRYIVRCVASGIASDDLDHIREKRVLGILSQLDDEEIMILDAYGSDPQTSREKFRKLQPQPAVIGSDRETVVRQELYEAAQVKLERLSLLRRQIDFDRSAEQNLGLKVPEFDQFSGQPIGHISITPVGQLVLRKIGLLGEEQ